MEKSTQRWKPEVEEGLTAVYTGNKLIISGVADGQDGKTQVTINVGEPIGSLGFIPTRVSQNFATYPTTDADFYSVRSYIDEAKYDTNTKTFIAQTGWNSSNIVDFHYRVNPNNAYIDEAAFAAFVGRNIQISRAAGDVAKVLKPVALDINAGEANVKARINKTQLSTTGEKNIVALQLWNGQDVTTSDYTYVETKWTNAVIVDSAAMNNPNTVVYFYNRTKAIVGTNGETSDFIKQFCPLNAPTNEKAELVYNDEAGLDLNKLPGLYSTEQSTWLKDLGFNSMTYKFTLPKEYKANDAQGTNQQWFVELTADNHLVVNKKNLNKDELTPAIGRTPVVRVDAYLEDNEGTSRMVASAYIKVNILPKKAEVPVEQDPIISEFIKEESINYNSLTSGWSYVNQMPWTDVNNAIYGKTGLTSNNFWNYYGVPAYNATIEVAVQDNGKDVTIIDPQNFYANSSTPGVVSEKGIRVEALLGAGNTQTANIKFQVNNNVLTQNTYDNVEGKGAKYTVTITIKSKDIYTRGDVVIKQIFYVKEECITYGFNPNFYDENAGYSITKGKLVNGKWALEMNISEVFKMDNGKNIFQYFNAANHNPNATAIHFYLDPANQPGVSYTEGTDNGTIELTTALTEPSLLAKMKYIVTLVNGEECTSKFNILFNNPFVSGNSKAITLNANETGVLTSDVKPSVVVVESNDPSSLIYSWSAASKSLVLSSKATGTYKVAEPTVRYDFVEDTAYEEFYGNLDIANGAKFGINTTTGVVTYDNLGATLVKSYTLHVKATVTFADLSEVTCTIPFIVKGTK